jgi:NAD(P)-dependent dehydrogenase (short-subunit alcohol dehydrogenase family)
LSKLDGKVALITGGTSGIGLATAELFQKEGAQVVVTGSRAAGVKQAQETLGAKALALQADASKLGDTANLVEQIRAKFGRIDILFANAGIAEFMPFDQVKEDFFDSQFDTNVKGLFFTVQAALALIPDGGTILLNASVASKKGFPGASVYSATKAAVRSFGRTLATELAARGIRVNTLSPGPVSTPIFARSGMPPEAIEQIQHGMAQGVALKRMGRPEEIAQTALFLVSADASFVNGIELFADGGLAEL